MLLDAYGCKGARARRWSGLMMLVVAACGCGGDGKKGRTGEAAWAGKREADLRAQAERDFWARLNECDVVGEGKVSGLFFDDLEPPALARCLVECAEQASCAELEALVCANDRPPAFEACGKECEELPLPCDGGGGTFLHEQQCDGVEQCKDGSDEKHCIDFQDCRDGTPINDEDICNGVEQCPGGDDELFCEQRFTCKDGQHLRNDQVCDGESDCMDGADERECPFVFVCDGGKRTLHPAFVCDGAFDCVDMSDEEGCAAICGQELTPEE